MGQARRVLVPIAGKSDEHELRSRLLATLCREAPRELVFFAVVPAAATDDEVAAATRALARLTNLEIPGTRTIEVVRSDEPAAAILAASASCDLLVLGMRRDKSGRKSLGPINRKLTTGATCALMLLSRRIQVVSVTGVTRPLRDVAQFVPFLPRRTVDE